MGTTLLFSTCSFKLPLEARRRVRVFLPIGLLISSMTFGRQCAVFCAFKTAVMVSPIAAAALSQLVLLRARRLAVGQAAVAHCMLLL